MKNKILLFTFTVVLFSCKKDDEPETPTPFAATSKGIYISNEGNFQTSNSTIFYFDPVSGNQTADVFKQVNNTSLGDICNTMNLLNGKLYLVVNNSGKIEVCDAYSLKSNKTISGLTSPRYITQVNSSKAYISDAYSNQVSVLRLSDNTVTGTININGWTEQMLVHNDKVYVTNLQSDYLYVVDTLNNQVSDSILITRGANSISIDKNGKIWVLCGGDYLLSINGYIHRIDPVSKVVESSSTFAANEYPNHLCINAGGDTVYYINSAIWRMEVTNNGLPVSPFIASSGNNFYGLGIDKVKNEIYVADAIDFIQKGKIFRYRADGTLIQDFTAGIIPGDFLFLP